MKKTKTSSSARDKRFAERRKRLIDEHEDVLKRLAGRDTDFEQRIDKLIDEHETVLKRLSDR
jgi:DNA-binding GntR family transcriptional regulator